MCIDTKEYMYITKNKTVDDLLNKYRVVKKKTRKQERFHKKAVMKGMQPLRPSAQYHAWRYQDMIQQPLSSLRLRFPAAD